MRVPLRPLTLWWRCGPEYLIEQPRSDPIPNILQADAGGLNDVLLSQEISKALVIDAVPRRASAVVAM